MPDAVCGLCGEPMPPGEEMFQYHGHSGPCPKPPLPKPAATDPLDGLRPIVLSTYLTNDELKKITTEARRLKDIGCNYDPETQRDWVELVAKHILFKAIDALPIQ